MGRQTMHSVTAVFLCLLLAGRGKMWGMHGEGSDKGHGEDVQRIVRGGEIINESCLCIMWDGQEEVWREVLPSRGGGWGHIYLQMTVLPAPTVWRRQREREIDR